MAEQDQVSFQRGDDTTLLVRFSGAWRLRGGFPSASLVDRELQSAAQVRGVAFDTKELISWDSSVLAFLVELSELCRQRGINMDRAGLPAGVRRLLDLAEAVPEKKGARKEEAEAPFLERVGNTAIGAGDSLGEMLKFLGEMSITFVRLFRMKARFRAVDLFLLIQQCGAQALPIVTLISFLVGVILAFVGAVQLKQFGAQIYVADLVGIAMVHEMGAMMTGIIMAGRTGAAFAAQLGTMKVTQEIDAFTTLGFSPLEFLVLPRVIALVLMMPLLCLYADFVGVLGGAVIGRLGMLDLSWTTYFRETIHAVCADGPFRRRVQERGLRCAGRPFGLLTGHSMRQQFLRRRRCGNLRCGHGHRRHCGCLRHFCRRLLRPGDLTWQAQPRTGTIARPHITVSHLTMAYGSFVLMRDLNFTINHGDVFIIMGGSGCGKSTLLRHLIGLNEPAQGEIFYRATKILLKPIRPKGRRCSDAWACCFRAARSGAR